LPRFSHFREIATFIGGSGSFDSDYSLELNDNGIVFVAGPTSSPDFPINHPLPGQDVLRGAQDGFVALLDLREATPPESQLMFSTFLGGSGGEQVRAMALDDAGRIFMTGFSGSLDFPVTPNAAQPTFGGGFLDVFLMVLTAGNNQAPVAKDDSAVTPEDSPVTVPVLDNDTDPDGDTLAPILVQDVVHGTLTLQEDGSFTYLPEPNFHGIDSFTYQASDGNALSNTAIVTILVEAHGGLGDAPWPMFQGDVQHTGRSEHVGPQSPTLRWTFPLQGTPGSPVIVADGTIYVGLDGLRAYTPDGKFKWYRPGRSDARAVIGQDDVVYWRNVDFGKLIATNPDGTEKWSVSARGMADNLVTQVPGTIIASDGTVYVAAVQGTGASRIYVHSAFGDAAAPAPVTFSMAVDTVSLTNNGLSRGVDYYTSLSPAFALMAVDDLNGDRRRRLTTAEPAAASLRVKDGERVTSKDAPLSDLTYYESFKADDPAWSDPETAISTIADDVASLWELTRAENWLLERNGANNSATQEASDSMQAYSTLGEGIPGESGPYLHPVPRFKSGRSDRATPAAPR